MQKLILIGLLGCASLWCANTTVTKTIVAPTGDLPTFSCTFRLAVPVMNGVYQEVGGATQVQFTGGNLSVSLLPTDTMLPSGQAYSVTCGWPAQQINGHALAPYSWGPNYWIVPTSATPLDLSTVQLPYAISALPLPSNGQVLAWSTADLLYMPETIDTSLVGENGRLYFTTARARAALSGAGPISYSGTTGVIDCPTCLLSSGSFSDPLWLSLSASGGRISGLGGAAVLNVGTITGTVAAGDDSRLSNARTPTAHASSHQNGGIDEIATATPGANAIPKAGSGGALAVGWIPVGSTGSTVAAGNDPRFVKRILWSNTFMDAPESDATSGYRTFGTGGATIYFSFDILADWPGSLTLNLTGWSTTATLSPTITIQHVCISYGSTATKSYAHSQSMTVIPSAANGRSVAAPLTLDSTGCAAGSEYFASLTIAGNTTAFNVLRAWVTE